MIRVLHIIPSLDGGGAEWLLLRVLERMDRKRFDNRVISLRDRGSLGGRIAALAVPVVSLHMRPSMPNPLAIIRVARIIRDYRPQVIQTWLYHADLFGLIASKIAGFGGLCWGIHACDFDLREYPLLRVAVPLLARWSQLPQAVVVVSEAARRWHEQLGYHPRLWYHIPVGVNVDLFQADPAARGWLRQELKLESDTPLVGLIARFHPMKDHRTFLSAMANLAQGIRPVHVVMTGINVTSENAQLVRHIRELRLEGRVHMLGERTDVPRVMGGLDVVCSSSYTESCPTVICEAMACEVPCVVTDVGDSALIVGGTGKVVPPRDPQALGQACAALVLAGPEVRARLGRAARQRIVANFSIESVVSRYERLYERVAGRPKAGVDSLSSWSTTSEP